MGPGCTQHWQINTYLESRKVTARGPAPQRRPGRPRSSLGFTLTCVTALCRLPTFLNCRIA